VDHHHTHQEDDVNTTMLNLETLRSRAALPPRPDAEHLLRYRHSHPPPRRARRHVALGLAHLARRLDGDAAERALRV
jgi:hypothetical protein